MLVWKNIVYIEKICYYVSTHTFYSKKPPVLQILGGFLFCLPFDWTNYNLILYFKYVHVYISLLSTIKSSYDQPHM